MLSLATICYIQYATSPPGGYDFGNTPIPPSPCLKTKPKKETLFHYTDSASAFEIKEAGSITASPAKRFGGFTFPSGAYATDIKPTDTGYTQRTLSVLFYGGNESRDVSWYVEIEKSGFSLLQYPGFPHQWIYYAPEGTPVPVNVMHVGPNSMAP